MSSGAALSMFGPMLEIGPRVLLVMACGLLALAAVRISAHSMRQGCAGVFLAGWELGIVGVCGARIGFTSLAFYGSQPMLQGVPDPISGLEVWRFLRAYEAPIALAVGSGVLIALWLRRGHEVGTTKASSREARWRRIGAAGEARVAAELENRAPRASQCRSLRRGLVRGARSRRSCAVGDRSAGNQDLRRNDRGPTQFSSVDTAHGRRSRAGWIGQSGAAEPGARMGVGGFSGRPAGADTRFRRLGRQSAVCTGNRERGRFRSRSTMGAVDFRCRGDPARSRCGVAADRARGGEEPRPRCATHEAYARRRRGGVRDSAADVIARAPGMRRMPGRSSVARDLWEAEHCRPVPMSSDRRHARAISLPRLRAPWLTDKTGPRPAG